MTKDALFSVTVNCKAHPSYRRAGVGFVAGEQIVEMTQEQLDIVTADPFLTVIEVTDAAPVSGKASGKASGKPAATEPAATEPAATEPAATEPAATEPATGKGGKGKAKAGA